MYEIVNFTHEIINITRVSVSFTRNTSKAMRDFCLHFCENAVFCRKTYVGSGFNLNICRQSAFFCPCQMLSAKRAKWEATESVYIHWR